MNIEESLERIAIALEAIVESQGIVAGTIPPAPHDDAQEELDLDPEEEEEELDELEEEEEDLSEMEEEELDDDLDDDGLEDEAPPARPIRGRKKKKKVAKKKAKKKVQKKTRVGKPTVEESEYTADEVRAKLKDLQLATGSAARAKSILKKHGASTFGQLSVGRYDAVVRDVDAQLED